MDNHILDPNYICMLFELGEQYTLSDKGNNHLASLKYFYNQLFIFDELNNNNEDIIDFFNKKLSIKGNDNMYHTRQILDLDLDPKVKLESNILYYSFNFVNYDILDPVSNIELTDIEKQEMIFVYNNKYFKNTIFDSNFSNLMTKSFIFNSNLYKHKISEIYVRSESELDKLDKLDITNTMIEFTIKIGHNKILIDILETSYMMYSFISDDNKVNKTIYNKDGEDKWIDISRLLNIKFKQSDNEDIYSLFIYKILEKKYKDKKVSINDSTVTMEYEFELNDEKFKFELKYNLDFMFIFNKHLYKKGLDKYTYRSNNYIYSEIQKI